MRARIALTAGTAALALAGSVLGAAPAMAQDTTTTFELTAGSTGLSLSAPASKNLGVVALGANPTADLGAVKVDDQRGTLLGTWTATVSSSDFITGDATAGSANLAARTIAKTNATYNPKLLTDATTVGTGVFAPGVAGAMTAARSAFTGTALVGVNSATWTPTVTVAPPAAAVAGVYSGKITHSVA